MYNANKLSRKNRSLNFYNLIEYWLHSSLMGMYPIYYCLIFVSVILNPKPDWLFEKQNSNQNAIRKKIQILKIKPTCYTHTTTTKQYTDTTHVVVHTIIIFVCFCCT